MAHLDRSIHFFHCCSRIGCWLVSKINNGHGHRWFWDLISWTNPQVSVSCLPNPTNPQVSSCRYLPFIGKDGPRTVHTTRGFRKLPAVACICLSCTSSSSAAAWWYLDLRLHLYSVPSHLAAWWLSTPVWENLYPHWGNASQVGHGSHLGGSHMVKILTPNLMTANQDQSLVV